MKKLVKMIRQRAGTERVSVYQKTFLIFYLFMLASIAFAFVGLSYVLANPFLASSPVTDATSFDAQILDPAGKVVKEKFGLAPDPVGTYGVKWDLGALNLVDGSYTGRARSVNQWGKSSWTTVDFQKAIPGKPGGLGIITE